MVEVGGGWWRLMPHLHQPPEPSPTSTILLRSVFQNSCLGDHLPLRPDLRVDLAGPPLPALLHARLLVSPQRIDVHHCKGPVAFRRDDDLPDVTPIVDQGVAVEQLL